MENDSKSTKLVINLREGIVQFQGSEEFVRGIYNDFKERVVKPLILSPDQDQILTSESRAAAPRLTQNPRRTAKDLAAEGARSKVGSFKPMFNSNLNLAGLSTFYAKLAPTKHSEKILAFAVYLRDELKIAPCSVNDIYTCYFTLKSQTKIPEAFAQAFKDTKSRTHFIDYETLSEIRVTIAGENHFNEMTKKPAND
jgi:hypothetical protein